MDLGELEFKPEDFKIVLEMGLGRQIEFTEKGWAHFADHANRILREKLEKALEVFGCKGSDGKFHMDEREDYKHFPAYTHAARLVCVEEIKK